MKKFLLSSAIAAAMLSPAMAEECQLSLVDPSACRGPWTKMDEPYQWLIPSLPRIIFPATASMEALTRSEFEQQTPAMQFVGVMTELQFYSQHCLNFTPNHALINQVKTKLGITDRDIEAGKYNEEIEDVRSGAEITLSHYSDNPVRYCETYVPIGFEEDGRLHGFATTTKQR